MRLALLTACALLAAGITTSEAAPAAPTKRFVDRAAENLLSEVLSHGQSGEVVWARGAAEVIVEFDAPPPKDGEYVVRRRAETGPESFAQTIGVVRVAEVQGAVARCVVLASEGSIQPGDRVLAPERVTVLLQPTEASGLPKPTAAARTVDDRLELALLDKPRLRVVRADASTVERWRRDGFEHRREYALLVAPLLVSSGDRAKLLLRVRSLFTGQTLAWWEGATTLATPGAEAEPGAQSAGGKSIGQPTPEARAPQISTPGAGGAGPPAPAAESSTPSRASAAPYSSAIRTVEPAGIKAIQPSDDRVSLAVPQPLKGIAVGDVDDDGRQDVIGITDRRVVIYRWTGRELEPFVTGEPLPVFSAYLNVDAGDMNGNGRAEIVLTVMRSVPEGATVKNTLRSRVLELQDRRLEVLMPPTDRYLGVLRDEQGRSVLLAQTMGRYEPFDGPVTAYEWRDGQYQPAGRLRLPPSISSLYGFAWSDLDGDGEAELARVAGDGRLEISTPQGRSLWRGQDNLGEVTVRGFAQTPRVPDYTGVDFSHAFGETLTKWRTLPRRVLVAAGPAGPEIVTLANPPQHGFQVSLGAVVTRGPGEVVGYGWDPGNERFRQRWKSSELKGSALDVALGDLGGDGVLELAVLSGRPGGDRMVHVLTLYDR